MLNKLTFAYVKNTIQTFLTRTGFKTKCFLLCKYKSIVL